MVGTMEMASTEAKMVAEPVLSSTHIDIANRSIILPNSEMPCPATSSTKSRDSSGRWVGGAGDVILGFHCAIHSEPFSGSPANVIMPFAATVMSSSSKIGTPIASSMVAKQRMRCSISGRVAG